MERCPRCKKEFRSEVIWDPKTDHKCISKRRHEREVNRIMTNICTLERIYVLTVEMVAYILITESKNKQKLIWRVYKNKERYKSDIIRWGIELVFPFCPIFKDMKRSCISSYRVSIDRDLCSENIINEYYEGLQGRKLIACNKARIGVYLFKYRPKYGPWNIKDCGPIYCSYDCSVKGLDPVKDAYYFLGRYHVPDFIYDSKWERDGYLFVIEDGILKYKKIEKLHKSSDLIAIIRELISN